MAQAVVVESSQTSGQELRMGEESVLSRHRRTNVEICGTHRNAESLGAAFMEATALCGEYTHTATPKDQRGGQPLRSPMGFVFRAKGKRFDGTTNCRGWPAFHTRGLTHGLSRMKGNFHVR